MDKKQYKMDKKNVKCFTLDKYSNIKTKNDWINYLITYNYDVKNTERYGKFEKDSPLSKLYKKNKEIVLNKYKHFSSLSLKII